MVKNISKLTLIVLALASSSPAWAAPATYHLQAKKSRIVFKYETNVMGLKGRAKAMQSEVAFDVETGQVTTPMRLEIPVKSLGTRNVVRNRDMRKMFRHKEYPTIVWDSPKITCARQAARNSYLCDTIGKLKIRDVERKTSFNVVLVILENSIRASGNLSFELRDFGLEPPSLAGMIRVGQPITIEFDTLWARKP